MTVAYVSTGIVTSYGTAATVNLPYPATTTAGNILIAALVGKYPATVNTPSGWELVGFGVHGTIAAVTGDGGSMYGYAFKKVATGSEGGTTQTFTMAGDNSAQSGQGQITQYSKTVGPDWLIEAVVGIDNVADASWSAAAASSLPLAAGDRLQINFAVPTSEVTGISANAITASGATIDTPTVYRGYFASTGTNRNGHAGMQSLVSAGSSTVGPTHTATLAGSVFTRAYGVSLFTRIREGTAVAPTFDPPANLVATAVSASQIDLTWNSVATATGYDVERDGTVIATDVVGTSYSDTGRAASTQYTYRVRAAK